MIFVQWRLPPGWAAAFLFFMECVGGAQKVCQRGGLEVWGPATLNWVAGGCPPEDARHRAVRLGLSEGPAASAASSGAGPWAEYGARAGCDVREQCWGSM